MGWPIESDYFEAVQNPHLCFRDPDLKNGRAAMTPLGLPRPITGAFASVYQFTCPSGRWAIRCFLREFADQQRRYDAISRRLRAANLPYVVGFEYQHEGIRIAGRWYPILKMEWIDGETLNTFVAKHLSQPDALRKLARQWAETMAALHKAGIAHGDLQHGNVLVSQSRVRLIDYDGMYVPDLNGMGTHEEGHRNYQHPARRGQFDAAIDNFSAWVIFVSLSILAIDPRLWQVVNGGDECLLFRREDFERPERSKVFESLDRSGRPELKALAAHFRALLRLPVDQVPNLEGGAGVAAAPSSAPPAGSASAVPDWLRGHVADRASEMSGTLLDPEPAVATGTASADWIIDHLVEQKPLPLPFTGLTVGLERAVLFALAMLTVAVAMLPGMGVHLGIRAGVISLNMVGSVLLLLWRYRSLDVVGQKATVVAREAVTKGLIRQTETAIAAVNAERDRVMVPLVLLDRAYRAAPSELQAETQALFARLEQALTKLASRRQSLRDKEIKDLLAVEQKHAAELKALNNQVGQTAYAETTEIAQLAVAVRDRHLAQRLRSATIAQASIQGVGPKLKDRLRAHGIHCAAEVDHRVYGISGIGPAKVNALKEWRYTVEVQAGMTTPQPNAADTNSVRNKYELHRRQLFAQSTAVKGREGQGRQDVIDRFVRYQSQVEEEEVKAKRKHDEDAAGGRLDHEQRRRSVADKFRREKTTVYARRRKLDDRLVELQRAIFNHQLVAVKTQRERERYRSVTFRQYALQVLGLWRNAA